MRGYRQILRKPLGALGRNALMGTITHVDTPRKVAALTFDDGPDPLYTPLFLDILRSHGARGTFFMPGRNMEAHPDIVRRTLEGGHCVCCHGWSHSSFPTMSSQRRREELRRWREFAGPNGQAVFRPPYGHQNVTSRLDALLTGNKVVTWSVVVDDWRIQDAATLSARLSGGLHPGCIVLLHDAILLTDEVRPGPDLALDRTPVLHALDMLLRERRDYSFVTLPELFECGPPVYRNWYYFSRSVA